MKMSERVNIMGCFLKSIMVSNTMNVTNEISCDLFNVWKQAVTNKSGAGNV